MDNACNVDSRTVSRKRQSGVVLIAIVAMVALGASYFVYAGMNASPAGQALRRSQHDADVLARAKAALIGQIGLNTAGPNEINPGRIPCPEALSDAGTANEGLPAGATPGNPFGTCAAGAFGRLPWKALGLEKLIDSAGEPLWYAVGAAWVQTTPGATLVINSDTPPSGGLTLSGTDAVALVFSPGAALEGQARSPVNGTAAPAIANYFEGENATPLDGIFAAQAPSPVFNDRVLALTRAEVLAHVEAAVADRFERQLAPGIRDAYSTSPWTATPTLPFATPFGDPSVSPTNAFKGSAGTAGGLLPVNYTTAGACSPTPCTPPPCDPSADPRCDPGFLAWQPAAVTVTSTGGATYQEHDCSAAGTPQVLTCRIRASTSLATYAAWMSFDMAVRASSVAMGLRRVNGTVPISGVDTASVNPPYGYSVTAAVLNTDGSATLQLSSRVAAGSGSILATLGSLTCEILGIPLCFEYTITIPMALLSDHSIVEPGNPATNWFYRNRWHEILHYAIASGVAPDQAAPRGCNTLPAATNPCLQTNYLRSTTIDEGSLRGLVLFAGRSLATAARPGGQVRPSADPLDWFEDVNGLAQTPYTARAPSLTAQRTFNDRVVVLDHN